MKIEGGNISGASEGECEVRYFRKQISMHTMKMCYSGLQNISYGGRIISNDKLMKN